MWTNFRQFRNIYPLCLKMHLEALKWQWCIILIHGHLFHCFLMFTSCIPCFGIILYPFNCSAFQSQLRAFLILHHNCYSVSSDKGYKERNKLVVILLPCLFFDGSSFLFFCMWQSDVCRQYCVLVGSAVAHRLHCSSLCLQLSLMGNGNDIYPFSRHTHKTYLTILMLSENVWLLRLSTATEKRTWLSLTCAICWPVGAA